jgi:uncharacterized membrane protein
MLARKTGEPRTCLELVESTWSAAVKPADVSRSWFVGGSKMKAIEGDRTLPFTRIVAAVVVPFLVLAFVILYFYPQRTGQHFAWPIQPNMTAMFMGAGYIGGAWLFVNAILGRPWHRVAAGFPPVTTFTVAMLLATLLHWDRFSHDRLGFILWFGLYVVTPFLVPFVWWQNRPADSGAPAPDDHTVPAVARWGLLLLGLLILVVALVGFASPGWLIEIWPWNLTPLTARVMSGWFALLGVGGIVISRDRRWSAWTVGLQAIGLWHALVVIAALLNPADFRNGLWNWYLVSVILVLIGMAALAIWMERARGRQPA